MQQNEIARENKFFNWTINSKNVFGLFFMAVAFPAGYHYLHKSEMAIRDEKAGEKRREYY